MLDFYTFITSDQLFVNREQVFSWFEVAFKMDGMHCANVKRQITNQLQSINVSSKAELSNETIENLIKLL